jgi:hypothetical protein
MEQTHFRMIKAGLKHGPGETHSETTLWKRPRRAERKKKTPGKQWNFVNGRVRTALQRVGFIWAICCGQGIQATQRQTQHLRRYQIKQEGGFESFPKVH